MTYDITAISPEIDFAPGPAQEIVQNVRMILTTPRFAVPLDRGFGLDGTLLDAPLAVAQARLSAEIIDAINRYEPRADVLAVTVNGDGLDGRLLPTVRVRINE